MAGPAAEELQHLGLGDRSMLIAYGSETGMAQDIAEELGRMTERLHFDTLVDEMNNVELRDLLKYTLVIFVTSTTGQGDMPQNLATFWKSLLRKKLPPTCLGRLRFTVFGLGDSSYSKFNWAARKLHKRILQLGATEFYPPGEGDERHDDGIDSIYLPWSKDLRNHLLTSHPLPPSVQPIPDDTALLSKYIVRLAPEMWSASRVPALTAEEKNDPDRLWEAVKDKPAAISHLDKPRSQGEQFDADWERFAGPDRAVEVAARQDDMASRGTASETKLTHLDKDNILKDAPEKYLLRSASSRILDGPPAGILPIPKSVPALVGENNRITPPDHWQDVRHLVLTVPTKDDRNIPKALLPGSTVTIYPKNFPEDVQTLITMMGWEDVADRVVEWGFREQTPRKAQLGIPPFKLYAPKESTLRDLLTHNFDITAVPKRSFIQDISLLAATPNEKERLQELLFPDNTMEFYDYTSRPRRTIIEVLRDFPSVRIPFDRIAGLLPLIRGREFSIASGGADVRDSESNDLQLELLIGIVEYKTIIRKPRQGLCSRYVKFLEPGTKIGITIKSGSNPPCDEAAAKRPLVAIAAGTGVAPIRSLILERAMHKPSGPTLLFFGCRNRAKDFYFREEWEDHEEQSGGQFQVIPAFSRDPEAQDPSITDPYPPPTSAAGVMAYDYDRGKMYVQHQIRHHAAEVCALLRQNAVIALCGSSGRMPGSVRAALRDAMVMGGLAENSERAEELLGRMDFWQEVW